MSQVKNTPIPTERRSPFPLDGKGLYTLVRKVLPFKRKDLGWSATLSIYFRIILKVKILLEPYIQT